MTQGNPGDPNDGSGGGDKPPRPHHQIVEAIKALGKKYEAAQEGRSDHDRKTLFWTRNAGLGVGFYTLITLGIAVVALCQLHISRDTEVRQLRAYLYVRRFPISVSSATASATIEINHAGNTPAYNVRVDADILVDQYLVGKLKLSDVTSPNVSHVLHSQYSILYSTEHLPETISMPPYAAEAMKLALAPNSNYRFYAYGVVRYFDIFGLDKLQPERRYEFCFVYEPRTGDIGTERGCEDYNKPG
jgi:hypothetical protein